MAVQDAERKDGDRVGRDAHRETATDGKVGLECPEQRGKPLRVVGDENVDAGGTGVDQRGERHPPIAPGRPFRRHDTDDLMARTTDDRRDALQHRRQPGEDRDPHLRKLTLRERDATSGDRLPSCVAPIRPQPARAQKVAPHDLRHSRAALLFAAGIPAPKVAAVRRHADARVTLMVYARLVESQPSERPVGDGQSLAHVNVCSSTH